MGRGKQLGAAAKRLRRIAAGALVAGAFALAAVMLVPALFGLQRYVITGDSMTGTLDRGSLVFSELVPVADLKVGDVITYVPPPGSGPQGRVTHRIISVEAGGDGRPVMQTKGDANTVADPWRFSPDGPDQARAVFYLSYVGYLLGALNIREVRMVVIGLPALLIAIGLLARLWRDAGIEARRREQAETGSA